MSELALKLIRECKETRSTRLDLGNCGLTELPDELFELVWLEELILGNIWYDYDIDTTQIVLNGTHEVNNGNYNYFHQIPQAIKKLVNLRVFVYTVDGFKLDVFNCRELGNLKNLNKLILEGLDIDDFSFLKEMQFLEVLNIGVTNFNNFEHIEKLVNLKFLYFSNYEQNRQQVLNFSSIAHLKDIESLFIENADIHNLQPLNELINLKTIKINNTNISDLTPLRYVIENGVSVKWSRETYVNNGIYISNCPLTNPPKEIVKQGNEAILNYWKQIDKQKVKIELENLQKELANLKLDIKTIKSKFISGNLNELNEELFARENRLKKLNMASTELSGLELFNFILEENLTRNNATVELYEAKLIIVGEGATGKTTLFEKLKDNNHQVGNTPETHGINIHEGLPFTHTHIGDNTFHANLWDFGGQELQYMTHQFFLTPRALYVLMMDARKESPNLSYWFKIISLLGRDNADSTEKVRLLLVFNKRGNTTGTPPQYQDQLKYYEDSLDVQYLEVDFAENDYRFENLQNCIKQSLVTLPIVKSQLPRLWKAVREDLREEAKTENYIDTKRFSAICSKHGITEEADQWLLSGYLHQLGSLLHFQNDKGLRRLVILSPQWAVDGVYTFLSEESIARNNGRFTENEFMALLAKRNYNRNDTDVILQLMTKNNFDICYEATEGNYVAAQLLPDNAPPYAWLPKEVLQFRYQYPIMPKGLMSRLIVRLSDDIQRDEKSKEQIVWKKGVVLHIKLKEGECRVRLREDDAESKSGLRQILIDVMGERDARKYALRRVRDTVDDLHKRWFRSIKADEMVPCCCSECTVSDTPQLYKLENLLKRRLKRPDTSCDVSGEDLMIQQLLEGVYDKGEIRDMENQGRYA